MPLDAKGCHWILYYDWTPVKTNIDLGWSWCNQIGYSLHFTARSQALARWWCGARLGGICPPRFGEASWQIKVQWEFSKTAGHHLLRLLNITKQVFWWQVLHISSRIQLFEIFWAWYLAWYLVLNWKNKETQQKLPKAPVLGYLPVPAPVDVFCSFPEDERILVERAEMRKHYIQGGCIGWSNM